MFIDFIVFHFHEFQISAWTYSQAQQTEIFGLKSNLVELEDSEAFGGGFNNIFEFLTNFLPVFGRKHTAQILQNQRLQIPGLVTDNIQEQQKRVHIGDCGVDYDNFLNELIVDFGQCEEKGFGRYFVQIAQNYFVFLDNEGFSLELLEHRVGLMAGAWWVGRLPVMQIRPHLFRTTIFLL